MTASLLPQVLVSVATVLVVFGGYEFAYHQRIRLAGRAHELLPRMNVPLRRRAYMGVARAGGQIKLLARAEGMPGYQWVVIDHKPPVRGLHPMECHEERLGWARTRWGARRQLARVS